MNIGKLDFKLKTDTKEADETFDYLEKRIKEISKMAQKAKIEPIEITVNARILNTNAMSNILDGYNCFKSIERSLQTNKKFMKFFKEADNDLLRDNCQSLAMHYIVAIDKILERIEELEGGKE